MALTLDGVATGIGSSRNTNAATLTTTSAGDIICVLAYNEHSGGASSITGISDTAGLTWTKRVQSNGSVNGSAELWWAHAPTALSADVITATYGANYDDASMIVFGVTGCDTGAPFDTTSGFPYTQSLTSGGTPSFTNVNTANASEFLVFGWGTEGNANTTGTLPTGFALLGQAYNGGGSLWSNAVAAYDVTSAALASATVAWGSAIGSWTEAIFDALVAPSVAPAYWRLNCSAAQNVGSAVSVAELQLRTTMGGSQAATGGTATSSGNTSGNTPANAFDGNTSTYWQSTGVPAQLEYQLATGANMVEYTVTAPSGANAMQVPSEWHLEYSLDGSTWTTADRVIDYAWTAGQTKTYEIGANTGSPGAASGAHGIYSLKPAYISTTPVGHGARLMGNRSANEATTVSGTVSVLGTATAGLLVRAYDRLSGAMLGQTTTDGSGHYSINCGGFTDVYVVAFDPTTYQAIVYDEVTPG